MQEVRTEDVFVVDEEDEDKEEEEEDEDEDEDEDEEEEEEEEEDGEEDEDEDEVGGSRFDNVSGDFLFFEMILMRTLPSGMTLFWTFGSFAHFSS